MTLILASSSAIRLQLLTAAGVSVTALPVRVDEEQIRLSLMAEGAKPRDIADTLAEMKARKAAEKRMASGGTEYVLGCDQILECQGRIFAKPNTPSEAAENLATLRGQTHRLLSAAVLYHQGEPVWRHVAEARLTMRHFSDSYLEDYLARNWESIRHSVGGYKLEEEGSRLFSAITGDYFTVLGLPLLPLLGYLQDRGTIAS